MCWKKNLWGYSEWHSKLSYLLCIYGLLAPNVYSHWFGQVAVVSKALLIVRVDYSHLSCCFCCVFLLEHKAFTAIFPGKKKRTSGKNSQIVSMLFLSISSSFRMTTGVRPRRQSQAPLSTVFPRRTLPGSVRIWKTALGWTANVTWA